MNIKRQFRLIIDVMISGVAIVLNKPIFGMSEAFCELRRWP